MEQNDGAIEFLLRLGRAGYGKVRPAEGILGLLRFLSKASTNYDDY